MANLNYPEWRCTRNRPYHGVNCAGRTDVTARQGYYVRAATKEDAIAKMLEHFQDDWQFGFTADFWKLPDGMSREHYEEMLMV